MKTLLNGWKKQKIEENEMRKYLEKLGFWDKHGYQTIDGPYSQPPLGVQKSSCDYLLFAVKLLHGTYSSGILADHYLDLNAGFFKTFTTPEYAGQILKQTEEAIQKSLRDTMKEYLALLKEVNTMREAEEAKKEARGNADVPHRMK